MSDIALALHVVIILVKIRRHGLSTASSSNNAPLDKSLVIRLLSVVLSAM